MRNRTFEYVFQQMMWLLGTAAQLIASMGVGLKWMFMTCRCITFAMMDLAYFIPHVVWYILSPNIIRRVSYRSSHTTKLRNLEALLVQNVVQESNEPSSGITFSWKDKKARKNRGVSSAPVMPDGPDSVDYDAVERFARTINPADGTFVNGLPMDITDEANKSTSFFSGAFNTKNSFDDTLAALQRIYRHRSQQQQQQISMLGSQQPNHDDHRAAPESPKLTRTPSPSTESFTDSENDDDVEDRMNLHNRATLDIYLPVPLDSLFRFMDQERKSSETSGRSRASSPSVKAGKHSTNAKAHTDETYHKSRLMRKRFPIVISVNGGAWIIGCYLWNFLIARLFAARGYVVFCPDYRNFPQTTMEGMTLDVSDAIAWVLNNAERYNGDLNNVTLIGQSAGAHLTMMSLLSQAQLSAYRSNTLSGMYENVPPPSDVAYNVPRYNPRESIHRYVGLSGMYNIEGLVDHFQQEGLNTPVLHQIAGGRDQLARYSIHAYFDDRRNGDTGEVLPQNIFDYFPQRMFFVHGDADRSAPVTESASLVAMLRRAQTRYTLRRSEHNEEARRHALRSRRLLPGALASSGGGVGLNNDDDGSTGLLGAGGRRSSPAQRSAGEEDGSRCCGSAATRAFNDSAALGSHRHGGGGNDDTGAGGDEGTGYNAPRRPHVCDYADNAAAGGGGGGGGQSVLMEDASTRHGFFYGGGGPSAPTQQPSSSPPPLQHVQPPPTIVSPIVPPSRQDHPKPAVELEFIVIPNGRHSDAFVDECIAAGRSCCVDFLCDYESAVDFPTSSFTNSVGFDAEAESLCGSLQASSSAAYRSAEHIPAWMTQSPEECAMPDGILPLAVPTEQRSLPLRLCTLICPF